MIRYSERQEALSGMTPSLREKVFQEVFSATRYLSLHVGDPSSTGENEVSGGEYRRQAVPFVVSGGTFPEATSEKLIAFRNMPEAMITHVGLWDKAEDGSFLWSGDVLVRVKDEYRTGTLQVFSGDRVEFGVGDLFALFEN